MLLSVSDLACRRGSRLVLDRVSFALGPGDALILRGPNGSGKTTLLRTLAGLSPPARGSATPEAVAYAGHADGLKAQLSVAENLGFWARVFGARGIGEAIAAFALEALLPRRAADLSAGQRRRAGLARLPLTGRSVWLLDEPTVSLDADGIGALARAMADHRASGGAVVAATHAPIELPGAAVLDVAALAATRGAAIDDPFADSIE